MAPEELESFIQRNKLTHLGGQCIFCSIITNDTKSYRIASNTKNIAVLEINPLSRGHSLIIPKEHTEETNDLSYRLAQEIGRKIKEKFNPKEIKLNKEIIMGHGILEVIPIYGDEKQKRVATKEELEELQEKIKEVKEIEIKKKEEFIEKKEAIPVLPPRIP